MRSAFIPNHYDPLAPVTCDNCGHQQVAETLNPIADPGLRLSSGDPLPAGECTACGSLSYVDGSLKPHVPADIASAVQAIWGTLHGYQDGLIPFEKCQQLADDYRDIGNEFAANGYQETADMYRAEWDGICENMALIIESLGLTQEECS